ncbi:MAG: lasso RiPP family leader peptide-containing protein [Actinomycetota bacterium]|nr:lasso RiPP family leader peptide-containing protein [Actinomycetota bacterium]
MDNSRYEAPEITVIGSLGEVTQKAGIFFDFGFSTQGRNTPPPPGSPGTVS